MSEFTEMLRSFAQWLEEHPAAREDFPSTKYTDKEIPMLDGWRVLHPEFSKGAMAKSAMAIGGKWLKDSDDTYYWLKQEILPGVEYQIYVGREAVCTARVVGQETVEVADPNAPKVTVTRDVVEWDCPDILSARDGEAK